MKRLDQLLLFITLFVLAPITVDAALVDIYFYNAANQTDTVGKTADLPYDGTYYYVNYDGTDLYSLCGKSQTVYFKLYVDQNGRRTLSPTDATVATDGTPNATFTQANNSATAQFDMGSDYANNKYLFQIQINNDGKLATVKVTKKPAPSKYWVSTDNGSSWAEIPSGSSIYKNSFKLKKVQGSTTTYFTANDRTLTLGTAATVASTEPDSTQATTFTFDSTNSGPYGYTLTFNDSSLTVTDKSADYAYYLVINELNKSFRLVPSRSRKGKPLSTQLFTINFKDDELRKLFTEANVTTPTAITYYIKKVKAGEDDVNFRPSKDNYEIATTSKSTSGNVEYETYKDTKKSGTTGNNFKLTLGSGVSYTWQFDNSGNCPLTLDINKASLDQNLTYSLLGNFSQAQAHIQINPKVNAYHNKLTRVVYTRSRQGIGIPSDKPVTEKAGGGYTVTLTDGGTAEDVDSVIYRITVPRPAEGWGQLYLIVAPTNKVGANWKDSYWDTETIRPQVQGYSPGNANTGMDGIALRGGLFKATGSKNSSKTATTNMDQALNPQVTTRYDDATSYTFSMNATTSTYRIIFSSDKMYIIGTGVSSTNEDKEETTVKDASGKDVTMYKVGLVWDHEKQCFKHVDGNGKEAPVTLSSRSGSNGFRFAYGGNFTNTWFGENGNNTSSNTDDPNVPADLSSKDNAYTAGGENFDNQYVNHVQSYVSSSNTYADSTMDIKFQLPATDATNNTTRVFIRLYLKLIDDEAHYFYDIRKSYTFHRCAYTDNSLGLDGGLKDTDYFRMFSDYQARKKPSYMDAYVLTNVSAESAIFTKLETDYIPANTGVLLIAHLADKLKGKAPSQVNITLGLHADKPQAKYTGDNYLAAQIPDTTLNYKNNDGTFNYIIVNHSVETSGDSYLKSGLHFYRPTANAKTGRSYAYLKNIKEAIDKSKDSPAKEANLVIPIDSEGELDFIHATQISQEDNNAYYTLQGVRVAAPTTKGIYIHNGKKTIVR